MYRLAGSGALLRVYVGRYVRIPAASVRAYIKANTVEAVSPTPVRSARPGLVLVGVCAKGTVDMVNPHAEDREDGAPGLVVHAADRGRDVYRQLGPAHRVQSDGERADTLFALLAAGGVAAVSYPG